MKTVVLLASLLCCSFVLGCKTDSTAVASNGLAEQREYEVIGMLTLNVGNGIKCEATIENLKGSITPVPGEKPRSKLLIRNLSNGKTIYEEECGDSTLSYPGFDIGRGAGLVMTTRGGSGDGIHVYEVTDSGARTVLAEGYRAAAIVMPNDKLGGDMGFLIVDSESGTSPLVVRRYQYDDRTKKYMLTGKTSFSELIDSINARFERATKWP